MYGVEEANSAAQVSMRLYAGRTPRRSRRACTALASVPDSTPSRASEKPIALSRRNPCASCGRPPVSIPRSAATIFSSSRRNHGSNRVVSWISATDNPARSACAAISRRSGLGWLSAARNASAPPSPGTSTGSSPVRPVSIERRPFCSASLKERPIDIASPTDFMLVDNRAGLPGNFSKVKRGILITT